MGANINEGYSMEAEFNFCENVIFDLENAKSTRAEMQVTFDL